MNNRDKSFHLAPSVCNFGCVILAGTWHTVEVIESSVIYETKDGCETLDEFIAKKNNSENSETLPIIYLLEILKIIRIFISQYRDVIKCKTIATTP